MSSVCLTVEALFPFQLLKHLVDFCDILSERYAIEDQTTVSNKIT